MTEPRLFHYTCDHGAAGIRSDGFVTPSLHPTLTVTTDLVTLAWFTDLEAPIAEALGLTSFTLACDRKEYRFEVDPAGAVWWPSWRRTYLRSSADRAASRAAVRGLEEAAGAMPAHWWVSETDLRVLPQMAGDRGSR